MLSITDGERAEDSGMNTGSAYTVKHIQNDSRFDWVEAERLAALPDFGVLAELRALREDVSNG